MLRVKNLHFGLSLDPPGLWGEAKLSYIHNDIRRGIAKSRLSKLTSVFYHLSSDVPKQLAALAHLGFTRRAVTSYIY